MWYDVFAQHLIYYENVGKPLYLDECKITTALTCLNMYLLVANYREKIGGKR